MEKHVGVVIDVQIYMSECMRVPLELGNAQNIKIWSLATGMESMQCFDTEVL